MFENNISLSLIYRYVKFRIITDVSDDLVLFRHICELVDYNYYLDLMQQVYTPKRQTGVVSTIDALPLLFKRKLDDFIDFF